MASRLTGKKPNRPAEKYLIDVNLLDEGTPEIYRLPLSQVNYGQKFLKHRFGRQSPKHNVKTIMVLGSTGSGKTTLINTMINYILGVNWEDPFRYKLINEETGRSQAESQTSSVTAYEISHQEGFRIPYSLIIVDTPGFGDTRGIEQDKLITEQIREFFTSPHGVDQIDAVCFVAQASLARLTPAQKYIFDSILAIFGEDIKDNIRVLVTFADGQVPPVLEAIKESDIPCPKDSKEQPIHFKFNNSATFVQTGSSGDHDSEDDDNFGQMYWKMGSTNMKRFFGALETMVPQSLSLTKEVLQERKQLDVSVQGLQEQINERLIKLGEINETQQTLKKYKAEVKKNEKFEYDCTVQDKQKVPLQSTAFNCQKCEFTCHDSCDGWTMFCPAMDWWGNCRVCTGKCDKTYHRLEKYKHVSCTKTEKKTYQDLKAKYEKAYGETMTYEKLNQKQEMEIVEIELKVQELVGTLTGCLARLDIIALKPNPLSNLDYMNLMIEMEKRDGKPGFMERIKSLEAVKEQVKLLDEIAKGNLELKEHKK